MVCPPCLCGRMLVYYDIQSVSFFLHKNKVLVVDCETGCLFTCSPFCGLGPTLESGSSPLDYYTNWKVPKHFSKNVKMFLQKDVLNLPQKNTERLNIWRHWISLLIFFYDTMFFPEQTVRTIVQCHVNIFQTCFEMENWKTCVLTSDFGLSEGRVSV